MSQRSESAEEYLEAIFKLARRPLGATISRLAAELALSAPSVSQMVARLAEKGLVARDHDNRVVLTATGHVEAAALVRRHRLSERFLTDYLALPWDQVHDQACKLEHVLSAEVAARLDARLGHPQRCPHGQLIPGEDGELPADEGRPLTELGVGERGIISCVTDERPDFLRYVASLGLLPETLVAVEEVAPFAGPLLIRVGRARYALGREVADKISVREVRSGGPRI
ncbi:MAG: metal-dependent transcriptional regulator [Thermoleophilia bacterium]